VHRIEVVRGLGADELILQHAQAGHALGGHGPGYGEMPLAWAQDEVSAVRPAL
jgi:hypothetical protein